MLNLTNNQQAGAAVILAATMLLAVVVSDSVALRLVLALPLVLCAPGHLLLLALRIDLKPIEHFVTAICVSIGVCFALCFVLYGLAGLTPRDWAYGYLAVVVLLAIWITIQSPARSVTIEWRFWQSTGFRWVYVVLVVAAVVLASAAYDMAIQDEANSREFWYTELWLIPTTPSKFILGVRNDETAEETYDVSVRTDDGVLAEVHGLTLNPGQVWTREIVSHTKAYAELYLHQNGGRIRYRHVSALPTSSVKR
jgi:uncharacterized membrane protein